MLICMLQVRSSRKFRPTEKANQQKKNSKLKVGEGKCENKFGKNTPSDTSSSFRRLLRQTKLFLEY